MLATNQLWKRFTRLSSSGSSQLALRPALNLFSCFPKAFPNQGPPHDPFQINLNLLRREYRSLQSLSHPDKSHSIDANASADASNASSVINRAYTILKNPYLRAAHAVHLHHPQHIDVTQDDVSKAFLSSVHENSGEEALEYKQMLLQVLDAHESLEFANSESDLHALTLENNKRIDESQDRVQECFQRSKVPWDALVLEVIRLKYWVNIDNAIREWEPGTPILLTH